MENNNLLFNNKFLTPKTLNSVKKDLKINYISPLTSSRSNWTTCIKKINSESPKLVKDKYNFNNMNDNKLYYKKYSHLFLNFKNSSKNKAPQTQLCV
jgi:hypothetical protein